MYSQQQEFIKILRAFDNPRKEYNTTDRLIMFINYLNKQKKLLEALKQAALKAVSNNKEQYTNIRIDETTQAAADKIIKHYFRLWDKAADNK